MIETAATPGARLKAAREQRGLSLAKAGAELHLEPWVIEALESGDYERIGPSVYGKGYLKRYATLLGLPVEEMLAGFGTVPASTEPSQSPVSASRENAPARPVSTPQMAGAAAVMLLVVALAWWKPWEQRVGAPVPATSVEATSAPRAADIPGEPAVLASDTPAATQPAGKIPALRGGLPATSSPAMTGKAPAPAMSAAPSLAMTAKPPAADTATVDPTQLPGAGKARLRLSFTADSWVEVHDALGNRAFAGTGSANTVRNISGQAPMHVYVRIASGVQLEINGQVVAIGPQYFAGDAARFEAGADGVLRREPRRDSTAANARPPG